MAIVKKGERKGACNWEGACWRDSGVAGKILSSDVGDGYKNFYLIIIH